MEWSIMNKLKILKVENYENVEFQFLVEDLTGRQFWMDATEVVCNNIFNYIGAIVNAEIKINGTIKKVTKQKIGIKLYYREDFDTIDFKVIGILKKFKNELLINVNGLLIIPNKKIDLKEGDYVLCEAAPYISLCNIIKESNLNINIKNKNIIYATPKNEISVQLTKEFKTKKIKEKWL
jgi:hypothetical protein